MANYKKKNGNRKRERLYGFRNLLNRSAYGSSWRINSLIRCFVRQSKQADED